MKFNYLSKLYTLPPRCHSILMPILAYLSRFSLLWAVCFMLMTLGPGDIAADCLKPVALWKLEESGAGVIFPLSFC